MTSAPSSPELRRPTGPPRGGREDRAMARARRAAMAEAAGAVVARHGHEAPVANLARAFRAAAASRALF